MRIRTTNSWAFHSATSGSMIAPLCILCRRVPLMSSLHYLHVFFIRENIMSAHKMYNKFGIWKLESQNPACLYLTLRQTIKGGEYPIIHSEE